MKNEYIEVVKRWLADKDSVSQEELEANADAAYAAYDLAPAAAYAAADDALYAAYSAAYDANAAYAAYWVKRYEELTNG